MKSSWGTPNRHSRDILTFEPEMGRVCLMGTLCGIIR